MLRALLAATLLLLNFGSLLAASSVAQEDHARFEQEVRTQLRHHRHLSRVPLEWVRDHPPFLFLVQKPEGAGAGYVAEVVSRKLEWLSALHRRFTEDYVEPMGLRLRADRPWLVVVVLADEEELCLCLEAAGEELFVGRPARYGLTDRFLLLREVPGRAPSGEPLERHLERSEAAHQLVHGHGPAVEGTPGPFWLWAGLAGDLAANRQLAKPALDQLVEVLQQPAAREAYLLPLSSVLRQSSLESVVRSCGSKAAKGFAFDKSEAISTYEAMASAFFHYLSTDATEPIPERMRDYTERAIKNRLGEKPLSEYLGDVDLDELERGFWPYVWDAARRSWPGRQLDTGQLSDFLAARGGTGAVGEGSPVVGPARMIETLLDPDARLALAISRARAGDPEAALRLLAGALAIAPPEEVVQRIGREQERLRAWIELRDGFFAHLAESDKKFSFDHEGKKLTAKVTEVKDGRVHFEKNRRGVESLAFAEIDSVELARRMRDRKYAFETTWAVVYPGVLANDPKAKRLMRGDAPEVKALASDFESDYPARGEAIEVAGMLLELTAAAGGTSVGDARKALEGIGAIWSKKTKVAFLAGLEGDLCVLAETLLVRVFDDGGVTEVLAGEAKTLEDGRVQVKYDFGDEKQLADWALEETPGRRHAAYGALQSEERSFSCANGKLIGVGQTSLTHRLQFEGPQSIHWKARMLAIEGQEEPLELNFEVSLCNGPREARIGVLNSLGLDVVDAKTGALHRQTPDEVKIVFDTVYELQLDHDGRSKVTFHRAGKEIFSEACHGCVCGTVVLWLHTDYVIEFDDVEITGRPTEASIEALRDCWVTAKVAELGF